MNMYPALDTAAKSFLCLSLKVSGSTSKRRKEHKSDSSWAVSSPLFLFASHTSFCFSWLTGRLEGERDRYIDMYKENSVSCPNLPQIGSCLWMAITPSQYPLLQWTFNCPNGPMLLTLEIWSCVTLRYHFITHTECKSYKGSVPHFTFLPLTLRRAQPRPGDGAGLMGPWASLASNVV